MWPAPWDGPTLGLSQQSTTTKAKVMFNNFDPKLLDDPEFKEDAVREIIITPILTRLGYSPSGKRRIIRSKSLVHPFIYVGTRKHPVTIIPDYTLLNDKSTLLILDAKSPREDVLSRENVQQAYSYAIHPEIRCKHFALCNGKTLVVFSADNDKPIFIIQFEDFESRWEDIERYIGPRFLEQPALRNFAPDFGGALVRLGFAVGSKITLIPAQLNMVARVSDSLMTASSNCDFADRPHCVSFDFHPNLLPRILSGLPTALAEAFTDALGHSPFMAAAELAIELDVDTKIGPATAGHSEVFHPLVVETVLGSRFNPISLLREAKDIPDHVFSLRRACKIL